MNEYVRDKNGNVRYIIRKISSNFKEILDPNGNKLGFIRDGSTFTSSGSLVARGEDISALVR